MPLVTMFLEVTRVPVNQVTPETERLAGLEITVRPLLPSMVVAPPMPLANPLFLESSVLASQDFLEMERLVMTSTNVPTGPLCAIPTPLATTFLEVTRVLVNQVILEMERLADLEIIARACALSMAAVPQTLCASPLSLESSVLASRDFPEMERLVMTSTNVPTDLPSAIPMPLVTTFLEVTRVLVNQVTPETERLATLVITA